MTNEQIIKQLEELIDDREAFCICDFIRKMQGLIFSSKQGRNEDNEKTYRQPRHVNTAQRL